MSLVAALGCEGTIVGAADDGDNADSDNATTAIEPPNDTGHPDERPASESGMVELALTESTADILNPERGYYTGVDLLSPGGANALRDNGYSLAIGLVRLDDYRDAPLDDALLAQLGEGFAVARAAGVKIILRFTYNASFSADAPKQRVLEHIAQLAPVLAANEDVIASMQAGFIGAWGEWHGSTNGLDNDGDRIDILHALLDALPSSRSVQVRTPMYKAAMFPDGPMDALPIDDSDLKARIGHHNDCFLASESDMGTYASPVSSWMEYLAEETKYVPMGGETCAIYQPRTNCEAAVAAMQLHHWSYLNRAYQQDVIDGWIEAGCQSEVRKRLGYRFFASRAAHSETVAPGGVLAIEADIVNRGFAAPFNRRDVFAVLTDATGARRVAPLVDVDPRRWAAGTTSRVSAAIKLPADLPTGDYTLSLWLPDRALSLAADSRYAIRFANNVGWNADSGDNVLSTAVRVQAGAGGSHQPPTTELL